MAVAVVLLHLPTTRHMLKSQVAWLQMLGLTVWSYHLIIKIACLRYVVCVRDINISTSGMPSENICWYIIVFVSPTHTEYTCQDYTLELPIIFGESVG